MKPFLFALTLLLTQAVAQETPHGVIRGRVIRAGSGEAIADADINLQVSRTGGSAATLARTTSGGDGRFTLTGVAPGQYTITVHQEGFFPEAQAASPEIAAIPVTVNTAGEAAEISVSLVRAAIIAGRVTDSSGQLLPRANVQALAVSYQNGSPGLKPASARMSNDHGEFRLFWLHPGEYVIQAAPQTPSPATKAGSLKAFYPNVTDVAAATRLIVKAGDELTGIDIALPSAETKLTSKPVRISGQVLSTLPGTGMPAPAAATLLLLPHDGSDESAARVVGNSDSNTGQFEIEGLGAGLYDLYAGVADPQGSAGRGGAVQAWGRALIDVRDRDLENVRLVVHPSVNVNGAVKVIGGAAKVAAAIRIGLDPDGSSAKLPNYQGVIDRSQVPKADGSFTIPAVAEGNYKVQARGLSPDSYIADIRQSGSSVYESGIYVADKTPALVEVTVGADGARLQGTAAPSAIVFIVPALQLHRRAFYRSVMAGAEGQFVISGIRPGDYIVFAALNFPEGAYPNEEFLIKNESYGKPVHLMPSTSTSVQVSPIVPPPR